jgi:S1-C subfamily serine protease
VKKELWQHLAPAPEGGAKVEGDFKIEKPPIGAFFVVCPGVYQDGDEKVEVAPGGVGALHGVKKPFGDKPRLGVKATDAGKDEGALIGGFVEGSPAAAAGLKVGDRLIALEGATIKGQEDLVKALESKKPGDEVELTVRRAGRAEPLAIKVKLGGS